MEQTEQKTQHTPGPWEYEPSPGTGCIYGKERNEHITICDPHAVGCSTADDVAEANARLIAAAPNLLAACKAIDAKQQDPSIFRLPGNCQEMTDLRAAIAKAEPLKAI